MVLLVVQWLAILLPTRIWLLSETGKLESGRKDRRLGETATRYCAEFQVDSTDEIKNPQRISAVRVCQCFSAGAAVLLGAQEGTRTPTVLPPLGPEPSASTNSATWASPAKARF